MSGAFIDKIHPEINVRYNSVNVTYGKQEQEKTMIALEEVIKISFKLLKMRMKVIDLSQC